MAFTGDEMGAMRGPAPRLGAQGVNLPNFSNRSQNDANTKRPSMPTLIQAAMRRQAVRRWMKENNGLGREDLPQTPTTPADPTTTPATPNPTTSSDSGERFGVGYRMPLTGGSFAAWKAAHGYGPAPTTPTTPTTPDPNAPAPGAGGLDFLSANPGLMALFQQMAQGWKPWS
jgi:hypothetical protein